MAMILKSLQRVSACEEVEAAMSRVIADGEIPTGAFFPAERDLAARLGVSRVVVREAAKALEQQGLVRIRHGIGVEVVNNPAFPFERTIARVVPENRERLRQCAGARLLVEPELAALASLHATAAVVRRIRAAHEAMEQASDLPTMVARDIEFHEQIAEAAGNKVLSLMLRSTVSIGRQSRAITLDKVGIAPALRQHGEILQAILSHNPGAARARMRKHLQSALSDLDSSI